MTNLRKFLVGLAVVVALLLPAGVVYAVMDSGSGSSGRPASGMMSGNMDRMHDQHQSQMQDHMNGMSGGMQGQMRGMQGGGHMGTATNGA